LVVAAAVVVGLAGEAAAACRGPWAEGVNYAAGDTVTYQGNVYTARVAHGCNGCGWNPVAAQSLWLLGGTCNGGGGNPTPTPTPTPGGPRPTNTPAPTAVPPGARIFAPYLDTDVAMNQGFNLANSMGSVSRMYTLAFILGRGCTPAWMGHSELNSTIGNMWGDQINALRARGGDVIIAFGGAAAPELAEACTNVTQLQAAYQAVVSRYGLRYIDLDIESFGNLDNRSRALAGLQRANPNLRIHFTLGVLETGLTQPQLDVLNSAKRAGLRVDLVNIMAMDYGHPVSNMGAAAVSAAQGTRAQLNSLGMNGTQIGITPMIGQNDSGGEIFTLANASSTVSWARSNGVALMGFWSVGRDNGGCAGSGAASATCSGVSQSTFQFSSLFRAFQ
jgi:chitinase